MNDDDDILSRWSRDHLCFYHIVVTILVAVVGSVVAVVALFFLFFLFFYFYYFSYKYIILY